MWSHCHKPFWINVFSVASPLPIRTLQLTSFSFLFGFVLIFMFYFFLFCLCFFFTTAEIAVKYKIQSLVFLKSFLHYLLPFCLSHCIKTSLPVSLSHLPFYSFFFFKVRVQRSTSYLSHFSLSHSHFLCFGLLTLLATLSLSLSLSLFLSLSLSLYFQLSFSALLTLLFSLPLSLFLSLSALLLFATLSLLS